MKSEDPAYPDIAAATAMLRPNYKAETATLLIQEHCNGSHFFRILDTETFATLAHAPCLYDTKEAALAAGVRVLAFKQYETIYGDATTHSPIQQPPLSAQ